jgi:hypothetical protein
MLPLIILIVLNVFLTTLLWLSNEDTPKKIKLSIVIWLLPFWGLILLLVYAPTLPPAIKLTLTIVLNGLVGFLFIVFAGAGAGNTNQADFFTSRLLPIELMFFALLCVASIILLAKKWTRTASYLPFATVP